MTQNPTHPRTSPALPTLVLAATGKTGRRVADLLEQDGVPVRRGSRSAPVPFDWDDPATWPAALEGMGAVYVVYSPDLAVPSAPPAIAALIEAARAAGVRRLVLLSGRGEPEAQRCERMVLDSGLEATVVRASWFAQNFDEGAFHGMVLAGELTLPVEDVREPFVDADDVAEVAVAALTQEGHAGEVYEVTGPRALTFAEAVDELARAAGRDLRFVSVPHEPFLEGLRAAGLPGSQVELLSYLFREVLDGRNSATADGVRRALGRPARDLADFARDAARRGAFDPARQEA